MHKFKIRRQSTDRPANPTDDAEQDGDTSRADEMQISEFREILDDSPTDEMEVIPAEKGS